MRTAGTLEILETTKGEIPAKSPYGFSDFYVFNVKFGTLRETKVGVTAPLFRDSQIAEMNAFGAATEGDAFE